jgi:hypothetical protein
MTEAAESLIAQLYSQGNLPTPRHKNRKIRHENEILKANEHATEEQKLKIYRIVHVHKLQIYRMTPKTTKSRETIPLSVRTHYFANDRIFWLIWPNGLVRSWQHRFPILLGSS